MLKTNLIIIIDKPLSNGLHPLYIRILHNRKKRDIRLNIECEKEHFNNEQLTKQHKNHKIDNQLLIKYKEKAWSIIRNFELNGDEFSFDKFVEEFKGINKNADLDVFMFFDEVIDELEKSNRLGNADVYKETKEAIVRFYKQYGNSKNLYFKQITPEFLEKFEVYMRSRGNTNGGISVKMRTFRALVNKAISRKLISKEYYSFNDYKISKLKSKPAKRALSVEEFRQFLNADLSNYPHLLDAFRYFLFSFYICNLIHIAHCIDSLKDYAKVKRTENSPIWYGLQITYPYLFEYDGTMYGIVYAIQYDFIKRYRNNGGIRAVSDYNIWNI